MVILDPGANAPLFPVGARYLVPFLVACRPCLPSLRGGIPSEGPGRSCPGSLRPTFLLALPTGETFVAFSPRSLLHDKMPRSEERRVGKECRSGWWSDHYKKKSI